MAKKSSSVSKQKSASKKSNIAARVREAIQETVSSMGYLLWDVEFVREGSELDLVVSIDRPEGIGLDDCEAVTHAINPIIDAMDPIEENYYLEVSSVGLERVLKTKEHLDFCRDCPVNVRLYAPLEESFGEFAGQKQLEGILGECTQDKITLCTAGDKLICLPIEKCSRIKTVCAD